MAVCRRRLVGTRKNHVLSLEVKNNLSVVAGIHGRQTCCLVSVRPEAGYTAAQCILPADRGLRRVHVEEVCPKKRGHRSG